MDDAALLITQHVNLILHIVCRLFGPEIARRVRDFFNEPVMVEFHNELSTVMRWDEGSELIVVNCDNTLARTYYGTDSTDCAAAFLAAIVLHELIHRLPERFPHTGGRDSRECEDTTRLTRWLRDELFRRLGCV
jgi:hypothetical protein